MPRVSDRILTALSGKRNQAAQINSDDGLNPPAPAEMPVCVMDSTDVETVVVTSEWTEIEIHAKQQTREHDSENGDDSLPAADCEQNESQSRRNTEESELQTEKHTNAEHYFGSSYNEHDAAEGSTQDKLAEEEHLEHNDKERQNLSCPSPPLDPALPAPATAADGAAALTFSAGTRRSTRKPKKTWKLKLVNLQKQKRKPGRQKRERAPLAPVNSETVLEVDGERGTSDNRSVHEFA